MRVDGTTIVMGREIVCGGRYGCGLHDAPRNGCRDANEGGVPIVEFESCSSSFSLANWNGVRSVCVVCATG